MVALESSVRSAGQFKGNNFLKLVYPLRLSAGIFSSIFSLKADRHFPSKSRMGGINEPARATELQKGRRKDSNVNMMERGSPTD